MPTKFAHDEHELAAAVGGGYVKRTKHPEADLWILNYTPKCQYEGAWTDLTRACRGLILDGEDNIIARPFPKFFNHTELNLGYFGSGPIEVTEKMDGSLGILYWIGDQPFIATRGSFNSEQAIEGTKMLREWWDHVESPTAVRQMTGFNNMRNKSFLFEIIYPENRVVVDYGRSRRLTLHAVIDTETGLDLRMPFWYPDVVRRHPYSNITDVLAAEQLPGHVSEGFVVRYLDSNARVKVKHEDYVRLHRIMTGLNPRHIWEIMAVRACEGEFTESKQWATYLGVDPARVEEIQGLGDWLADVPDEFFTWVKGVEGQISADFERVLLQSSNDFDRRPDGDRKAVAQYFADLPERDILFRMLDGKPFGHLIWKTVRPDVIPTSYS